MTAAPGARNGRANLHVVSPTDASKIRSAWDRVFNEDAKTPPAPPCPPWCVDQGAETHDFWDSVTFDNLYCRGHDGPSFADPDLAVEAWTGGTEVVGQGRVPLVVNVDEHPQLTPAQARRLAELLSAAADFCEVTERRALVWGVPQ